MSRRPPPRDEQFNRLEQRFGRQVDALSIEAKRALLIEAHRGVADISLMILADDRGELTGVNRAAVFEHLKAHPDALPFHLSAVS